MTKEYSYSPEAHNKYIEKLRKDFGTKVTDEDSMKVKPKTMEELTSSIHEAPKPLHLFGPLDMPDAKMSKKDENTLHGSKAKK